MGRLVSFPSGSSANAQSSAPSRRTLAEPSPAPSLQEALDRRDRHRRTVQEKAEDQQDRIQREVRNLFTQLQQDREALRAERDKLAQERQECQEERKKFRLSDWQANLPPPPPQLPSMQAPNQGFPKPACPVSHRAHGCQSATIPALVAAASDYPECALTRQALQHHGAHSRV